MTPDTYKAVIGGSKNHARLKAGLLIVVAVIIVAALAMGGYMLLHKSTKTPKAKQATSASAAKTIPDPNAPKPGAPSVTNAIVNTSNYANLGPYLTDPSDNTLYTYGGDKTGASNCTGSCLANWPIYEDTGPMTGLPKDIGTITRTDSQQVQYTYKGMPLYYYAGDNAGQVTANGLDNFHVATP